MFKKTRIIGISRLLLIVFSTLILGSCTSIPEGAIPVTGFEKEKYLGKWYEIARMDFKFERNLNNTTAEYALLEDGLISVQNRGYNYLTDEWQEAKGKAKFVEDEDVGRLKVSFFGPFYGGYNIIGLTADYQYALVAGGNLDLMWILGRDTNIPEDIKEEFLQIAADVGYQTEELIWVDHLE